MTRLTAAAILVLALVGLPNMGSYTKGIAQKKQLRKIEASVVLETLTIYNPIESQCDATPWIT
ncbi:MAG TPA: hypothetical protein VG737_18480, partial [Cyclobacteriaceae bacterium]|nr:hypothetical protein [Cyclobacteriaceae bacterium]